MELHTEQEREIKMEETGGAAVLICINLTVW